MDRNKELISLIFELSKALRCCQQDAIFCEDITFTQFYILELASAKGSIRLSELHEALYVEKSTTTRLVEPLVKKQLIVKEKTPEDSRATQIKLTENGKAIHANVWNCLQDYIGSIEMGIPDSKKEDIFEALKIFIKALQHSCPPK